MFRRLAALAAAPLLLAACDSAHDDSNSASGAGYPVSMPNCGVTVDVRSAPQRIVSLNQGSTEILLSLGLADRMAGTGTWTDPVLPSLAAANAGVTRLADDWPSLETVLAKEPDLVTASFESTFAKGGTAPRERFTALGVPTYLAPADCVGKKDNGADGVREQPLTMDLIYREIAELAKLTGVPGRGDTLVAELKGKVDAARAGVHPTGVSALFWFAESTSPYLAGCCGAPGIIANELGLKNVFDDTTEEWPQINWEVVAARNPTVLVLGDLTRKVQSAESAAAKIAFLESNPVTREMDAVKNKRYILVSGAELNPSLRTGYGIANVADGLRRLGLAG